MAMYFIIFHGILVHYSRPKRVSLLFKSKKHQEFNSTSLISRVIERVREERSRGFWPFYGHISISNWNMHFSWFVKNWPVPTKMYRNNWYFGQYRWRTFLCWVGVMDAGGGVACVRVWVVFEDGHTQWVPLWVLIGRTRGKRLWLGKRIGGE